jgi:hypothetical protein
MMSVNGLIIKLPICGCMMLTAITMVVELLDFCMIFNAPNWKVSLNG